VVVVEVLTGPAAAWLASRRDELNQRFRRAARRSESLDADAVLGVLGDLLPAVAGPEPSAGDLCSGVYDLVLLHISRGTWGKPGVRAMLETTVPALRSALLARPSILPALSNAVENLGEKGLEFAYALAALPVTDPGVLLDAGVVIAWRLGRAALRENALDLAGRLPPAIALSALGLSGDDAARRAAVVQGLRADAWSPPGTVATAGLRVVGRIGDFVGFGGVFQRPPTVLEGGDRHVVYVKDGDRRWRLDADCFGCMATPDAGADRVVKTPLTRGLFGRPGGDGLHADGMVVWGRSNLTIPSLAGATSYSLADGRLAAAFADTHRVTIAVAPR
jgi:hypothetical protein